MFVGWEGWTNKMPGKLKHALFVSLPEKIMVCYLKPNLSHMFHCFLMCFSALKTVNSAGDDQLKDGLAFWSRIKRATALGKAPKMGGFSMLNPSKSMIIYDNPWTYGLNPSNNVILLCFYWWKTGDESWRQKNLWTSVDAHGSDQTTGSNTMRIWLLKNAEWNHTSLAIWPAHIVGLPTICGANIQQFANNNRDLPMYIYI